MWQRPSTRWLTPAWFRRSRAIALSLALLLATLAGLGFTAPAQAALRVIEEAPGQVLYQTRHSLRDTADQPWQVVFFKRERPEGPPLIHLRLVGFPEAVTFQHPQPLPVQVDGATVGTAADVFKARSPGPNVGEYDFADLILTLPAAGFLQLELPLTAPRSLRVPYFVVRQWQAVARQSAPDFPPGSP